MVVFAIMLLLIVCLLIFYYIRSRYDGFVKDHSIAIKSLGALNNKYSFKTIPSFDMKNSYDNEEFYKSISPEDYLTYRLVYISKDVAVTIKDTEENRALFAKYNDEIKNTLRLGEYDTAELPKNEKWLEAAEKRVFESLKKKPTLYLKISIHLRLIRQNGSIVSTKKDIFGEEKINEIIKRLKNKNNGFYLDEEIWHSICRVERGKVSNKMRFAIYKRDGYRCKKCGRSNAHRDLEIDHIFPISKGGKSTFDNLQTLCHRCNTLKSNTIEPGAVDPRAKRYESAPSCPNCGIALVKRKGKYGDFYGCPNYPNCKHTEKNK